MDRRKDQLSQEHERIFIEMSRDLHEEPGSQNQKANPMRHMSPLTIETDFQTSRTTSCSQDRDRFIHPVVTETDKRTCFSPSQFYYSKLDGPLKSPGLFVPYADDKTRERLEHAIREVFEKNAPEYPSDILQPFPLQDPPKAKFKRQISTDSNDSNDNRAQVFPAKRSQPADSGKRIGSVQTPYPVMYHFEQEHFRNTAYTFPSEGKTNLERQNDIPHKMSAPDKTDSLDGSQIKMTAKSNHLTITSKNRDETISCGITSPSKTHVDRHQKTTTTCLKRSSSTVSSISIPETPYTKNLEWVVSAPSPNSVHDFLPATPLPLSAEVSHDKPCNRSSLSDGSEGQHTKCTGFSTDFHNETFVRDAVPVCTSSTISDNAKVTEKGFVFPQQSTVTDPILFSPRIASDRARPAFPSSTNTDRARPAFPSSTNTDRARPAFPSSTNTDRARPAFPSSTNANKAQRSSLDVRGQMCVEPKCKLSNDDIKDQHFYANVHQSTLRRQHDLIKHNIKPPSYPQQPDTEGYTEHNVTFELKENDEIYDRESFHHRSPHKGLYATTISDREKQGWPCARSPNRQKYENQNRPDFSKSSNRDSSSDFIMNSFNSSLSRSTSHSSPYCNSHQERAHEFVKLTELLQRRNGDDQTGVDYSGSENGKYKSLPDMMRPYSMIELSPSKFDIDRVREKVRTIYRSLSSPMEMKQMLKNLLIEEHMKEDFIVDDVFGDSFTSDSSDSPYRFARETGFHRNYHGFHEGHNARRRLFDAQRGDFGPRMFRTGINQRLEMADGRIDLTDILDEMYRERTEELEEQYRRSAKKDPSGALPAYINTSPGRPPPSPSRPLPSSGPTTSLLSEANVDCNMPGCSHSQTRVQRDNNRKRKRGDLEVHVRCEDDEVSMRSRGLQSALKKVEHSGGKNCSCASIESAILDMARNAYQKIRRMDSSEYSFDRFNDEATETREQIFDSVKVLCGIKSMCKYGRVIEDMFTGSIIFVINSPTKLALDDLWSMFTSGELRTLLNKTFITDRLKSKFNCSSARLEVHISSEEYKKAQAEIKPSLIQSPKLNTSLSKSDTEIASVCSSSKENYTVQRSPRKKVKPCALAIIHMRSQSAPSVNQSPSPSPLCLSPSSNSPFSRDRKFSFSNMGDNSPRKAFQEINPVSPSTKKVFDFDVSITSKLSPKRKTFGEIPPWENKNVQHGTSPKRRSIRD